MNTENPFATLSNQLARIESILVNLQKHQTLPETSNSDKANYLTVAETAQFLGVSQGSIYRYVMNGVLPKRKFGNKLYFPKRLLEDLIEKGA
jgi:excisionase family DNA binding protein